LPDACELPVEPASRAPRSAPHPTRRTGTKLDDEIRAVVTLVPQLAISVSRESNLVTVNA
jgi:hypothetical protein